MEYNNNSCYLRLRTHYLKYVTDFFFCFPPIQNLVFQSKFYPFKHWIKPISLSVQACLRDKHTHFRIHCEGLSDRKRNVHNISKSGERPRNAPVKQSHCRLRTTALVPLDPKMRQKKPSIIRVLCVWCYAINPRDSLFQVPYTSIVNHRL